MIVNADGHVLAIERGDTAGAWQLPQGGLDSSEEPLRAAYREIAEETGIQESDLTFVKACSELLVYELPPEARRDKTGRGQVLYWFLFRIRGNRQPDHATEPRITRMAMDAVSARDHGRDDLSQADVQTARAGVRQVSGPAKGLTRCDRRRGRNGLSQPLRAAPAW